MSEEKDNKKAIEDLKASVFKRINSIKENEKKISSSNTFETSDAEDYTPQKDKSYKQRVTKIYGPPGTGKTTKLINLVKDFIAKGVNPNDIGFFAFTNHSTEVAKDRITQAFPNLKLESDFSGFRTIHSMAYTTFQKSPNLLTEEQALDFNDKFTIEKPMMETDNPSSVVVRAKHPVLDVASVARSKLITFEEYLKNLSARDIYYLKKFLGYSYKNCIPPISKEDIEALIKFNQAYELYKNHLDVIDYTSILENALEQDKSIPEYEVVFVDEAQDLSKLQWRVVEKVFKKSQNIYIAGDDDQAICENMGASADTFINYKFDDEIILDQSYRVPPKVHQNLFGVDNIIGTLSKFFTNRKEKSWKPKDESQEGSFLKLSKRSFLDLIIKHPNKDWLIMGVTHQTLAKYSQLLKDLKISHILSNKVISVNQDDIKKLPSVELRTIWSAKGDEADCTALIRDNSFIDENMMKNDPRLVYVAQTRTKCLHFEVSEKYFSDLVDLDDHFENLSDIYIERKDNQDTNDQKNIVNKGINIKELIIPIENQSDLSGPLNTSTKSFSFLKETLLTAAEEKGLYELDKENLTKPLTEILNNIIETRIKQEFPPMPSSFESSLINKRIRE
ncbi:AAA family ATPase, partial [Alphaproteobacteria bacterium]|nr:AAA family ATPase [Alphaproteobacteria bacterium]